MVQLTTMQIVPRRQAYEDRKAIRSDRQSNRGRIIIAQPGLNTVRRRTAFDLAINFNGLTNVNAGIVRERLRKGWSMNESLTVAG